MLLLNINIWLNTMRKKKVERKRKHLAQPYNVMCLRSKKKV